MKKLKNASLALMFAIVTGITSMTAFPNEGHAAPPPFEPWLEELKQEAKERGIDPNLVERALNGQQPDQEIIRLDQKQPEFTQTFSNYAGKRVSSDRVRKGQEMLRRHYDELKRIGDQYGVAPQYIVALWGMETNYGGYTGNKDIVRSLMTLAWNGRDGTSPKRAAYFRNELLTVLEIVEDGHYTLEEMKGSWAGAFGQVQFMPTSFRNLAVDGDGDGRIDIRTNLSDAFASAANYLSKNGWKHDEKWGRQVKLPSGFNQSLVGEKKSLAEWQRLGIKTASGTALPVVAGMQATLLAPDGESGQIFLVYNNFHTIKRWNNSNSFALSVGMLADRISAATPNVN